MSKFEELFLAKKDKKASKEKAVSVPRVSRPRVPKTAQIDEKKLASVIGQVFDEKLQNLTTMLEKQAIPVAVQSSDEISRHKFNQKNLIWRIGTKGERGTKLYELHDFFFPTDAQTIKVMIDTLFSAKILKKSRNGWISLTDKGKQ